MDSHNLTVKIEDNNAIFQMGKEALGGNEAMVFANAIKNLPKNIACVALDMSNLELINSTGLGMIAKANNELKAKSIDLVLFAVNDNVSRLFEITHLNKVFKIVNSLDSVK